MGDIGKPKIAVDDVAVTGASLQEIDLLVSVSLENGNPVSIPLKSIDFEVFGVIGGEERMIASGHHGEFSMPPGKSAIKIPVTVKNQETVGAISDFLLQRSMNLRITGNARVDLAVMNYAIPFSEEMRYSF